MMTRKLMKNGKKKSTFGEKEKNQEHCLRSIGETYQIR